MEPQLFRDGRKRKWWIAYDMDLDGPFDSEEDAQSALDKLRALDKSHDMKNSDDN